MNRSCKHSPHVLVCFSSFENLSIVTVHSNFADLRIGICFVVIVVELEDLDRSPHQKIFYFFCSDNVILIVVLK